MKTETIKIEGMSCQHCVMAVKKELSKLDLNVKDVQIGSATIEYDENIIMKTDIDKAVEEAGFKTV
jgi:copper chaperone